jgi:NADH:ubiquinone oxidoreductase subunit 5 (subunit L)/multisubunit Na+/H+ antiporter MnhA subunit
MIRAALLDTGTIGIAAGLGVPVLALVGGLAALCFAKVYGVVFLGEPRSSHGKRAAENPPSMLAPMAVLGALCVAIGALPWLVLPVLERATSAWLAEIARHDLSALAPLRSVAWVNAAVTLAVIAVAAASAKTAWSSRAAHGPTWGCGYAPSSARMQYTASSFAEWIVGIFRFVLRPRGEQPELMGPFPKPSRFTSHVPEVVLDLGIVPAGTKLAEIASWFRWIQRGSVHLYLVYVLGALISMLFFWR